MTNRDVHEPAGPIRLKPRSFRRAVLGSFGLFAATGVVWAVITAIAPGFHASSSDPLTYTLTVGTVLLLFGAMVTGQVQAMRNWFQSLASVDHVSRRRVRTISRIAMVVVVIGIICATLIFVFNQFVWMPEVRELTGSK